MAYAALRQPPPRLAAGETRQETGTERPAKARNDRDGIQPPRGRASGTQEQVDRWPRGTSPSPPWRRQHVALGGNDSRAHAGERDAYDDLCSGPKNLFPGDVLVLAFKMLPSPLARSVHPTHLAPQHLLSLLRRARGAAGEGPWHLGTERAVQRDPLPQRREEDRRQELGGPLTCRVVVGGSGRG